MKILRGYLLRQHALPFVFAVTALTSFELLRQIARKLGDLIGKGLPWTVIVEFFLLTIPFLIAITLSMSVLVAVLYTMSRMTGDRELTAIRAGGVSLGQLLRPLLTAAALVALVSFLFGDQVLPRTNHRLRTLMTDIYRQKPTFSLKEHVINEVQKGRVLLRSAQIDYATYRLRDVTLYHLVDQTRTIYADSGYLAFAPNQEDLQLTLYQGAIHEFDREDPRVFQQTGFTRQTVLIRGVGTEFVRREGDDYRGDREMGICQLEDVVLAARREAVAIGRQAEEAATNGLRGLVRLQALAPDTTPPRLRRSLYCRALGVLGRWLGPAELEAQQGSRPAPPRREAAPQAARQDSGSRPLPPRLQEPQRRDLAGAVTPQARPANVRLLRERAHAAQVREAVYLVELHKKYSIPAACIVFVLVGVPLAVRFPRGGIGLVMGAGMGIFALYYIGLIAGETLANRLIVSPFLAMWGSNILMTIVGVLGLWWVRKEGTAPRRGRRRRAAPQHRTAAA
jgi:lipopolysaccharide export system permease protein